MLKSPNTPGTSDSQSSKQVFARNKEVNNRRELPYVVGIGKHIFVYRVDRGKWRVAIFVQIAGETCPRSAFLGTNIMRLDFTTRDEARDFRDHLLFDLANRMSAVYQVFFRSYGAYPDAEITNGWASASFKAADFGSAFKEPKKYAMVGIEEEP